MPQHVDVLQDHLTDLLSLSESTDQWASTKALICHLCNFEEDTLSRIRRIWKLWLKRLSSKQPITIETVKSKRDKCPIRAKNLQYHRECVRQLTSPVIYTDTVIDAMAADYDMYLKQGSAYAEMFSACTEISMQKVLNPTFFEEHGTYNMSCFATPYTSFLHSRFFSDENLSQWYPDMKGLWYVDKKNLEDHPLLGNSVQQFTVYLTAAGCILTSWRDEKIKFYFNNLDAIAHCQKLSRESNKFDCVDSSNLIDYLSPLVLVVSSMPLVNKGGYMLSSSMIYQVADSVEKYLSDMFGFDPKLIPSLFGIKFWFRECTGCDARKIIWYTSTQLLKIGSLDSRSDIVDALIGLTKVTTINEKLFREFRATAETAVLSYCCFASNLHHDDPIETYQFWDSLCMRLRNDDKMQSYLLHIQTHALLHNLHIHLVISTDQCPLCTQQALPIDHVSIKLEDSIFGGEGLFAKFGNPIHVHHAVNSMAYERTVRNHVTVCFFMPSFYFDWKGDFVTLISSKGIKVVHPSIAVCSKPPFPYSFVQVFKSSTRAMQAIQGTAIGPSLGVEVGCSSCGKRNAALKRCPCHLVVYCNEICQRTHWPMHKLQHTTAMLKK